MSDLTRRVLEWDAADPDEYGCFDPMLAMADAAPTLARQIEAVEALADRLENEAAYEASRGDTWDAQCIRSEAARIRDALTEAEKRNTP